MDILACPMCKGDLKLTIVEEDKKEEADLKIGRISVASPLARGLLGHEVGDEVRVVMPAGPRAFEVLEVSWA